MVKGYVFESGQLADDTSWQPGLAPRPRPSLLVMSDSDMEFGGGMGSGDGGYD